MKKSHISNLLRELKLIYFADWIRYFIQKIITKLTGILS